MLGELRTAREGLGVLVERLSLCCGRRLAVSAVLPIQMYWKSFQIYHRRGVKGSIFMSNKVK